MDFNAFFFINWHSLNAFCLKEVLTIRGKNRVEWPREKPTNTKFPLSLTFGFTDASKYLQTLSLIKHFYLQNWTGNCLLMPS